MRREPNDAPPAEPDTAGATDDPTADRPKFVDKRRAQRQDWRTLGLPPFAKDGSAKGG